MRETMREMMREETSTDNTSALTGVAATRDAVLKGLRAEPKSLPFWLLYDAAGSALYERIMRLPEYYPTRTERHLFERHATEILAAALAGGAGPVTVIELGAGNAEKTVVLLAPLQTLAPGSRYVPVDVSPTALAVAVGNMHRALPDLAVTPLVATNDDVLVMPAATGERRVVLFIGSSIGNLDDSQAVALLGAIRGAIGPAGALVLGTDLLKSPSLLVPAYDDAEGVTAAFNLNLLARINRELGADFDLTRFRHVALWNGARARMELYLESTCEQRVYVRALEREFMFRAGERIHTESSTKYDIAHIDRLLGAAGLLRQTTVQDELGWFGVHVVRLRTNE